MWHVRERISARDVTDIEYDDEKGTLVVQNTTGAAPGEQVPEDFDSITYAYSLTDARGFVEFRDGDGAVLKKIEDRWIAVENLTHRTVGTYPDIRLSAKKEDIRSITVTGTCVVIRGKPGPLRAPSTALAPGPLVTGCPSITRPGRAPVLRAERL